MNVGDLFAKLSYGELSNLAIGMEGAGTITPAMQPSIVNHTNFVLTQLYSRFSHKIYYVNLTLIEDQTNYFIRYAHAVTNPAVDDVDRYITDTEAYPFTGEIIKIRDIQEAVDTNLDGSTYIPINALMDTTSILTPSFDEVYVPDPVADIVLVLECQMNHAELSIPVDLAEEIVVIPALRGAVVARVAARVYASMNGEENANHAARLIAEYESICDLVKQEDLTQDSSAAITQKTLTGGWK